MNTVTICPSSQFSRVVRKITASYDAPTQTVKQAIREVLDAIPQIQDDPAPVIYLSEYQASSIQYVVRVWTTTAEYWNVYSHVGASRA